MLHGLQSPLRLDLRNQFNTLFEEARKKDSVLTPHPIMRVPLEIVREIFEAAARADPDALLHLLETCIAWRAFVLEWGLSEMWNLITSGLHEVQGYIEVDGKY